MKMRTNEQPAERQRHGKAAEHRPFQSLRPIVGQESEVEERAKKWRVSTTTGRSSNAHAPDGVEDLVRTGVKSGCSSRARRVLERIGPPARSRSRALSHETCPRKA